ncbi:HSPB1-associated protein 1 homolog [Lycorma delicatula]|uniref:HSPB1-associated protein 1 homolog n=1 Tax=Lycorma delicatula TaxID=130591 RepID=UPI003F50DD8A
MDHSMLTSLCQPNKSTLIASVSWKPFGFPEINGEDSTMWFGSEGAHTPCHFDSYSLNIVIQIYGKKMWIMFPPDSTDKMKPTRVPYEESSVYSKINFYVEILISQVFGLNEAYFVVLNPGDVLIVPNQWWHYVENLSTAISINTWIPLESDDEKRLEECLVRNFILSSINNLSITEQERILNPNEIEELLMDNSGADGTTQLNLCISRCKEKSLSTKKNSYTKDYITDLKDYKSIEIVNKLQMNDVKQFLCKKCKCNVNRENINKLKIPSDNIIDDYINAFCHPDIIVKVKEMLLLNK